MTDKIVFRCMQKATFTNDNLVSRIDKLVVVPSFSTYQIKPDMVKTLHRLKYSDMKKWPGDQFPCIADAEKDQGEIECICWQVHREKADEAQVYIKCSNCGKLQHRKCIQRKSCQKVIMPYKCPQCQLKILDPLSIPIASVVKPFKVSTLKGVSKAKFEQLKYCKKEFNLDDDFQAYLINKNEVLSLEARCVRVSQS